jgi:hypothetical protein
VYARPAVDAGLAYTASALGERECQVTSKRYSDGWKACEADSRIIRKQSILSYGTKIRRDTADEILNFLKSLAPTAGTDAPPQTLAWMARALSLGHGALRRETQRSTKTGREP